MARPFNRPGDWRRHIEQWKRSGLSLYAYATRHGLSRATLWRRSVRLAPPRMPITLAPATRRPAPASLITRHSGQELQLPAQTVAAWLADLLEHLL